MRELWWLGIRLGQNLRGDIICAIITIETKLKDTLNARNRNIKS